MQPIYTTTIRISPNSIDLNNHLKVSAFFEYIQAVASIHAESFDLGYDGMRSAGIFWVLSWVRLEILSFPGYRDQIQVTTWPKRSYRLFSLRDFLFISNSGETFCRCTTAWLPVDASTKRLTRLDRLPHPVPYQPDQIALDVLPEKLPDAQGLEVARRSIRYTDLDLLQHVNNARYVEYLQDSYPLEFHQNHRMSALTFSFVSEAHYVDELVLYREEQGQKHLVTAKNAESGNVVFQALAEWEDL
jgi:acyl-ACP thioesterase